MASESENSAPYSMTEEMLMRRLEKANSGRYFTQLYAMITACIGTLSFGTTFAWSSPLLFKMLKGGEALHEQYALIACLAPLGCSIGCLIWPYSTSEFGPKKTLFFTSLLNIGCWVVLMMIDDFKYVVASRFFNGFFAITFIICGECLLSDSVHQHNLRHMRVFVKSSSVFGMILVYMMGYFICLKIISTVCVGINCLHIVFLIFEPESPVHLYKRSVVRAERSLRWYQGDGNVNENMRIIKRNAESRTLNTATNRHALLAKVVFKPLIIVLTLAFVEVASGYYIFIFYNIEIFHELSKNQDDLLPVTVYSCCLYLFNLLSLYRTYYKSYIVKIPLIISCFFTGVILSCLSVFSHYHKASSPFTTKHYWLLLVLLCFYIFFYEFGVRNIPDYLLFRYMPIRVYFRAKNIQRTFFYFIISLLTRYYMKAKMYISLTVIFGILAVVLYFGAFFSCIFVVETKNKNLVQIQLAFGGNPTGTRGVDDEQQQQQQQRQRSNITNR